jgi:hypothetical protein
LGSASTQSLEPLLSRRLRTDSVAASLALARRKFRQTVVETVGIVDDGLSHGDRRADGRRLAHIALAEDAMPRLQR